MEWLEGKGGMPLRFVPPSRNALRPPSGGQPKQATALQVTLQVSLAPSQLPDPCTRSASPGSLPRKPPQAHVALSYLLAPALHGLVFPQVSPTLPPPASERSPSSLWKAFPPGHLPGQPPPLRRAENPSWKLPSTGGTLCWFPCLILIYLTALGPS